MQNSVYRGLQLAPIPLEEVIILFLFCVLLSLECQQISEHEKKNLKFSLIFDVIFTLLSRVWP